jgi:hypothetical protein
MRVDTGFLVVAFLALGVQGAEFFVYLRPFVPGNDDVLSLVLSSCRLGEAQAALSPEAKWPKLASDVVRLMGPPDRLTFRTVLSDVYALDIHPPLYFLLLHAWQWLFRGSVGTAILLSILTACLSACTLYAVLTWMVAPPAATLFCVLYVASPAYPQAALMARQYALSACFAILLAALISGACRSPRAALRDRSSASSLSPASRKRLRHLDLAAHLAL